MLTQVTAVRFDKVMGSGRTKPCLITAAHPDGEEVELVAKFAAGCDTKHRGLMAEAIAAVLAADLGLPVPEPFLVWIESDFAAIIPNSEVQSLVKASLGWNFGSKKLPPGFVTYPEDRPLPKTLWGTAAEILAFDTFIANPDRRVTNPNLLRNGDELAIYDHEQAFCTDMIIGWKPPWVPGAVQPDFRQGIPRENRHVLLEVLRGKGIDLGRLSGAFEAVSSERLTEYCDALPEEWIGDGSVLNRIVDYLAELRDNVDAAINEVKGALQ